MVLLVGIKVQTVMSNHRKCLNIMNKVQTANNNTKRCCMPNLTLSDQHNTPRSTEGHKQITKQTIFRGDQENTHVVSSPAKSPVSSPIIAHLHLERHNYHSDMWTRKNTNLTADENEKKIIRSLKSSCCRYLGEFHGGILYCT